MFEWDDAKRVSNLAKHGIDFVLAARIFEGPVLERVDDRAVYRESRFIALGRVVDACFVVVFTWRGNRRRLISAWKAGHRDTELYNAHFGN